MARKFNSRRGIYDPKYEVDRWDAIFVGLVLLAVSLHVNEQIVEGNILHDRGLLDNLFGIGGTLGIENTATLIENAPPSKQFLVGLINTVFLVVEWILGFVIAGVMIKLAMKAGWFGKNGNEL